MDGCWRAALAGVLLIWLALAAMRETFDLIGRLWLPVLFDLLQVLTCIAGLFAAAQRRERLLLVLAASTLLSVLYNLFVVAWYAEGRARAGHLLSGGLPHAHSFFLVHTPFCAAAYNVATGEWEQRRGCPLPFFYIEAIQATVHVVLALSTLVLSVGMLRRLRRARRNGKMTGGWSAAGAEFSANGQPAPCKSARHYRSRREGDVESIGEEEEDGRVSTRSASRRTTDSEGDVPATGYSNSLYGVAVIDQLSGDHRKSAPTSRINTTNNNNNKSGVAKKRAQKLQQQVTAAQPLEAWKSASSASSASSSSSSRVSSSSSSSTSGAGSVSSPIEDGGSGGRKRTSAKLENEKTHGEERGEEEDPPSALVSFDPKSNTLIRFHEHAPVSDKDRREHYEHRHRQQRRSSHRRRGRPTQQARHDDNQDDSTVAERRIGARLARSAGGPESGSGGGGTVASATASDGGDSGRPESRWTNVGGGNREDDGEPSAAYPPPTLQDPPLPPPRLPARRRQQPPIAVRSDEGRDEDCDEESDYLRPSSTSLFATTAALRSPASMVMTPYRAGPSSVISGAGTAASTVMLVCPRGPSTFSVTAEDVGNHLPTTVVGHYHAMDALRLVDEERNQHDQRERQQYAQPRRIAGNGDGSGGGGGGGGVQQLPVISTRALLV